MAEYRKHHCERILTRLLEDGLRGVTHVYTDESGIEAELCPGCGKPIGTAFAESLPLSPAEVIALRQRKAEDFAAAFAAL